jgi:hypothetical protein
LIREKKGEKEKERIGRGEWTRNKATFERIFFETEIPRRIAKEEKREPTQVKKERPDHA